jgi:hypothetical protein
MQKIWSFLGCPEPLTRGCKNEGLEPFNTSLCVLPILLGLDSLPTATAILQLAEGGGLDPQTLSGSHSLAKRIGPRPSHLP